jgi:hypothetical protein
MLRMNNLAGFGSKKASGSSYANVTWTNLTNVTDSPAGTLTKTGGSNNTFDAGAFSVEGLTGDGWFKYVLDTAQMTSLFYFGVSVTDSDATGASIDYVWAYVTANWRIYENNSYKGDFGGTRSNGDILEIRRVGTTITYWMNGSSVYTSGVSSTGTIKADISIYQSNDVMSAVAYKTGT